VAYCTNSKLLLLKLHHYSAKTAKTASLHLRGRSLIAIICKLCFGASVYHLWRHRNNLLHGNTLSPEDSIVLQVKNDVRLRLIARCTTKILYRYPHLVEVWRLQHVLSR
jgi:hypothetical protein